jgi:hypothetical protein
VGRDDGGVQDVGNTRSVRTHVGVRNEVAENDFQFWSRPTDKIL